MEAICYVHCLGGRNSAFKAQLYHWLSFRAAFIRFYSDIYLYIPPFTNSVIYSPLNYRICFIIVLAYAESENCIKMDFL